MVKCQLSAKIIQNLITFPLQEAKQILMISQEIAKYIFAVIDTIVEPILIGTV